MQRTPGLGLGLRGRVKAGLVGDALTLARGDRVDTHGRYHEEIEGGRAHDGRRAELARVEARGEDLDDREQYLRRGGAESHEGEVGDGAVPHGHVDPLLLTVDRHLGMGRGGAAQNNIKT